ncbi:MAG TPA: vWA domain-containing protein, partial [Nannocystis sp.]
MLRPLLALLLGFTAAAALHLWGPQVAPLHVELPAGLASWLSESGDRDLVLTQPAALWLLPLALLPYLVVVARRSLVDLHGWQVALQAVVRLLVLVALSLALAIPTLQSPRRGKTVVLAVDVSASVDDGQLAAAKQLVRDALRTIAGETGDREDRTRLRLLAYATAARAVPIADDPEADPDLSREPAGGLASDHAGALRLAEALLDPDTEGRVILVSDGAGSVAERADLAATARELQA